jgi:hypothetical protein
MIVAAGDLIKQGKMAEACQQLLDAYHRKELFSPEEGACGARTKNY